MSREIKFRAWDKLEKRMLGVQCIAHVDNGDVFIKATEKAIWEPLSNKTNQDGTENNEFELLQFTGLYDAHGAEIYEGDVVNYILPTMNKTQEILCIVDFGKGAYYLKETRFDGRFYLLMEVEQDDIVVIGNMYENPWMVENLNKGLC
ncbi:MAG TPA: YopX family protein [Anaerovoracaceae bacterium]|nr:YopX family protein [Anaerovoracaceae bacterium]